MTYFPFPLSSFHEWMGWQQLDDLFLRGHAGSDRHAVLVITRVSGTQTIIVVAPASLNSRLWITFFANEFRVKFCASKPFMAVYLAYTTLSSVLSLQIPVHHQCMKPKRIACWKFLMTIGLCILRAISTFRQDNVGTTILWL